MRTSSPFMPRVSERLPVTTRSEKPRIVLAIEPSDSADARWCLEQYFGELAARFEEGFGECAGAGSDFEDEFAGLHVRGGDEFAQLVVVV